MTTNQDVERTRIFDAVAGRMQLLRTSLADRRAGRSSDEILDYDLAEAIREMGEARVSLARLGGRP